MHHDFLYIFFHSSLTFISIHYSTIHFRSVLYFHCLLRHFHEKRYDNLQKYNLPYPEAVFDLRFYRNNPQPFCSLAKEIWPGVQHSPTLTHSFVTLLEQKGLLVRNYTQNIDGLEVLAGVSEDKIVECHGHFRTASCVACKQPHDGTDCQRKIVQDTEAPTCTSCGNYVKPDIVFFGEDLPARFNRLLRSDLAEADLLIVMGTSLTVAPVSLIPDMVNNNCKRVLFNRERVGNFKPNKKQKSSGNHIRDVVEEGDCDESTLALCQLLGWHDELLELNRSKQLQLA
jgi:NAD-dependent SIR2 family protein deacetylase